MKMELEELMYRQMAQLNTDDVKLTPTQNEAYSYMAQGKSIFLTGPAGTGKSTLIKLFRKVYGSQKNIAITSTTGISAILLGGTTLHSYLGIGLGTGSVGALTTKILKTPYLRKKWKQVDVLIIDEVSMLDPELFDKLEAIARAVRYDTRPFGGIQLILSGDMCQLPVVGSDDFCFEAETWDACVEETVYLNEIIRQTNPEFQTCLNEARIGKLSSTSKKLLKSCLYKKLTNDFGIKPTKLFPTNAQVDYMNEKELDILAEDEREFKQYDMEIEVYGSVKNREYVLEKYRKNCIASEELQLCKDSQVMLLHNLDIDSGLVNGSRGVVTGFIEDLPVVKFLNGQERTIDYHIWEMMDQDTKLMSITQIPLKLAYAVTIHKIQGATLDYAEVDLENVFEYGQAYCAISRVRSPDGLSLTGLDFKKIKAHPKAKKYYKNLS